LGAAAVALQAALKTGALVFADVAGAL
jgi:hypothetical protein